MKDLGEQNLTLLEQGKKAAAKAALDETEGDKELNAEVLTTGDVEVSLDTTITKTPKGLGWLKGGTFTTFAKVNVQKVKDVVGGFRVTKKLLIAIGLMFVAAPALAQVPAQPGQNFKWDQPTAEVASIVRFEMKIDNGAFVDVGKVLANDANTPTNFQSFSRVIPALSPGTHTFVVRGCPASGACGPESNPFAFAIVVISQPTGLRIGN